MPGDSHLLSISFLELVALRKPELSKQIYSICVILCLTPGWIFPLFLKSRTERSESRDSCYVWWWLGVGNV